MTYNDRTRKIYILGGSNKLLTANESFKSFCLDSMRWEDEPYDSEVGGRSNHTCISYKEYLFVFGGKFVTRSCKPIVYIYNTLAKDWTHISRDFGPSARDNHTATLYNDHFFIYGIGDMYKFDCVNHFWNIVKIQGSSPPNRTKHSATTINHHMWVFGGYISVKRENETMWGKQMPLECNQLWKFDYSNSFWTNVSFSTGPSPRADFEMRCTNRFLVFFGGSSGYKVHDELYTYDTLYQTWKLTKTKKSLRCHAMEVVGDTMYTFGGNFGGKWETKLIVFPLLIDICLYSLFIRQNLSDVYFIF